MRSGVEKLPSRHSRQPYTCLLVLDPKPAMGLSNVTDLMLPSAYFLSMTPTPRSTLPVALILASFSQAQGPSRIIDPFISRRLMSAQPRTNQRLDYACLNMTEIPEESGL